MQIETKLPCCYFPTTIVAIDDDARFLSALQLKILKFSPCKIFDKSDEALKFLKETYIPNSFTKRCLIRQEDDNREHRIIETDIFMKKYIILSVMKRFQC